MADREVGRTRDSRKTNHQQRHRPFAGRAVTAPKSLRQAVGITVVRKLGLASSTPPCVESCLSGWKRTSLIFASQQTAFFCNNHQILCKSHRNCKHFSVNRCQQIGLRFHFFLMTSPVADHFQNGETVAKAPFLARHLSSREKIRGGIHGE